MGYDGLSPSEKSRHHAKAPLPASRALPRNPWKPDQMESDLRTWTASQLIAARPIVRWSSRERNQSCRG